MGFSHSPLRYPGGKTILSGFFAKVIEANNLLGGVYIEPFAGGAGAALSLLYSEHVSKIILNDADQYIYKFWKSMLWNTDKFIDLIVNTPVTIDEWERQRKVFKAPSSHSNLLVGFATFYLNRCNRSGILYAGPIGGRNQLSDWKIDARFNKDDLIKRIRRLSLFKNRITIYNLDAIEFLRYHVNPSNNLSDKLLVYLDPPYFKNGSKLYLNYYKYDDHLALANFINIQSDYRWIISYDDVAEIHKIYRDRRKNVIHLNYFAHKAKLGKELIITSQNFFLPEMPSFCLKK